ncbi:hypothetical protein U0070_025997 [Myodes glareolus]|uniref:PPM-type phosphatase domain-containing protein n=1 Tax=Myodes glareolus TaxID=447135 RepID=A0AAW0J263_MYOGA
MTMLSSQVMYHSTQAPIFLYSVRADTEHIPVIRNSTYNAVSATYEPARPPAPGPNLYSFMLVTRTSQRLSAYEKTTCTTCLIALLSDKDLTVANVGDSRGVLCDKDGNAIPLSHDHKPYQLKERKRIKRAGGFISFNGSWRVQGILAMSRSLGDYPLKNLNVVIPDPDILTFDLDKLQPEFMILASDGLWDAFSNEEAVRFIKERLDEPHFGAKSIVLQSFYRGCPDNITVMVVKFRNSSKTEEQ